MLSADLKLINHRFMIFPFITGNSAQAEEKLNKKFIKLLGFIQMAVGEK